MIASPRIDGIDCAEALEALESIFDGAIDDTATKKAVERHLGRCPSCRHAADDLVLVRGAIGSLLDEPLPELVRARIDAIAVEPELPAVRPSRRYAAAALVALLVGAAWFSFSIQERRAAALAQLDADVERVLALVGHTLEVRGVGDINPNDPINHGGAP